MGGGGGGEDGVGSKRAKQWRERSKRAGKRSNDRVKSFQLTLCAAGKFKQQQCE